MRKVMLIVAPLALAGAAATLAPAQARHPIYVGAEACARCHDGAGMGHQYSLWLLTQHAQAYTSLSLPTAKKIAELSGIPQDPHESPTCLGCHGTAAETEPWERDEGFVGTLGVQCEKCHGPGSEYMDASVMADRAAAAQAGLRIPDKTYCQKCHYAKGSHVAVHHKPPLDVDKAWETIAHHTPENPVVDGVPALEIGPPLPGPKYVGVAACNKCHNTAAMSRQGSVWRRGPHARAWAVLATPQAFAMARKAGIEGEPQKSDKCLRCHTTAHGAEPGRMVKGFTFTSGIGCEACHGAGSDYMSEAVMRDPVAAGKAGLKRVSGKTCASCHDQAHGKAFDYSTAVAAIAHPTHRPKPAVAEPHYKTPRNLAFTPDGREVWVACEAGNSLVIVDAKRRRKVAEVPVGGQPNDVTFSPDGRRAYVSNRLDDSVSVIDTASRKVLSTVAVGDDPHGLVTDRSGKTLFVLNTISNTVSVVDTASLKEVKRLATSRNPWSLARSPDGSRILITNTLSRFVPFRQPSLSEVTVVDADAAQVVNRLVVPETNLLQGIAWHPSGEFAFFTLNRTKNLVPMTRVLQGWTINNGLGIAWKDGTVDQVLLDEPNWYFADTADVTFTPDGRFALATSLSTNRVAIIDVERLLGVVKSASARERAETLPNHLGTSAEFILDYVSTPDAPNGIAAAPDSETAWVANMLDDSLTVIDMATRRAVQRVDLGGSRTITKVRLGEKLFHSANITFQRQFSCHSCHPDGHVDGLTYDIEADGLGISPVDNRTLRGILDTDPFKWEGTNPTLMRQCGARLAVFFTRIAPFSPEQLAALTEYICTIPRPPNRFRPIGAELTPAQARGKAMFERTHTNDGRVIPVDHRCVTCHFPPLYTNRSLHDVGTKTPSDRQGVFDVPHLNNIYGTAPYLHNGMADTLEEIWTRFNPYDTHGVTNDMTKDQLNDLIEFLKTL